MHIRIIDNETKSRDALIALCTAKHTVDVIEVGESFDIGGYDAVVLQSLATSAYGHEIIAHTKKPQRGLQFHPELHMDTTQGRELLSLVTGIDF